MYSELSNVIRMWDKHIHAFVSLAKATESPLARADANMPLSGLTVGVKDIIDVVGLSTHNGSETCFDAELASKDAEVVAALRAAGANVLGKTTTTEFAFTDPTDCRNPYDVFRTPGGSSSGSGAAVAAGLVDVALGTQTAGSLCRPAAYCGVIGFKPSYGLLSTVGVTPLAPSFDTVGIIAASVEFASKTFAAMKQTRGHVQSIETSALVVTNALLPTEVSSSDEAWAALCEASKALEDLNFGVRTEALITDVEAVVSNHRTVMNYEAAKAHGHLLSSDRASLLKPKFLAGLKAGLAVSEAEAAAARTVLQKARTQFWASLKDVDIVLTMAVPDGATLIDGTTGYQDWLTPWTVFGGPLLCLPWGLDSLGRPRSVMLAAHPGKDHELLALAAELEAQAPHLPRPQLPQ